MIFGQKNFLVKKKFFLGLSDFFENLGSSNTALRAVSQAYNKSDHNRFGMKVDARLTEPFWWELCSTNLIGL